MEGIGNILFKQKVRSKRHRASHQHMQWTEPTLNCRARACYPSGLF